MNAHAAVRTVRAILPACDDLRREPWQGSPNPSTGQCYVACEAVRALADEPLTPATVRHEGTVHWFLRDGRGRVLDPTWDQFSARPDYAAGVGRGFLTRDPSKRARAMLARVPAAGHNLDTEAARR